MGARDWWEWHRPYDDEGSRLARRLVVVQHLIREWLAARPPGPVKVISMCAGQGRDLLGVLTGHPRCGDVAARLVELDPRNAEAARVAAQAADLAGVEVVTGDASITTAYGPLVPADLVLVCGVFGNVADHDIENTVRHLPMLCSTQATVIWTRHRMEPDVTPTIRKWFGDQGFEEVDFVSPEGFLFGVGVHRLAAAPAPFRPGVRLFTFVR